MEKTSHLRVVFVMYIVSHGDTIYHIFTFYHLFINKRMPHSLIRFCNTRNFLWTLFLSKGCSKRNTMYWFSCSLKGKP